jgi:DNA-binding LacI/PurR family transcriptional regulator
MAATIRDVAKLAGVSASTVSRVLNQKGVISADTEQRIAKAMEQLHYVPNAMARSFANGSARTIALAIDVADAHAYSNAFFNNTVFGIETAAHEQGYNLIITSSTEDAPASADELIAGKKIDGIIYPVSLAGAAQLRRLERQSFPCVILGHPGDACIAADWVDINNTQAGMLAAQHLIENGYRNLTFLANSLGEIFSQDRITGIGRALQEAGLPELRVVSGAGDPEKAKALAETLLASEDPPDAFLCGDDRIALGAMRAVTGRAEEAGVLSFDDTQLTQYAEPAITSMAVDTFSLGKQAAQMLIRRIEGERGSLHQTLLSTQVIARASTHRRKG